MVDTIKDCFKYRTFCALQRCVWKGTKSRNDKQKKMKFYITSTQKSALDALINLEAADYEKKNWKPNEIHKYNSTAFIDTTILICFENHKPTKFSYKQIKLGNICDTKQSETDVELRLNDQEFDLFASRVPSFNLVLGQPWSTGICFSQTAKVVMDFSWCDEYPH